jgi:hypothetical protein
MEDSLIAALLALLLIITWQRAEGYLDLKSQIADLGVIAKHEDSLHFQPSDFNQTDSKLDSSVPLKK